VETRDEERRTGSAHGAELTQAGSECEENQRRDKTKKSRLGQQVSTRGIGVDCGAESLNLDAFSRTIRVLKPKGLK
jgi:hypothetical protein